MSKYIKCPRCDLNYIDPHQDMCDVCKAELGEPLNTFTEDEEELVLCPFCKRNLISPEEEMCQECSLAKEATSDFSEEDDSWREDLEGDELQTVDEELPPDGIVDDFGDEDVDEYTAEDEEKNYVDDDDFDEFGDYVFDPDEDVDSDDDVDDDDDFDDDDDL